MAAHSLLCFYILLPFMERNTVCVSLLYKLSALENKTLGIKAYNPSKNSVSFIQQGVSGALDLKAKAVGYFVLSILR